MNFWTTALLAEIKKEGLPPPITEHRFDTLNQRRWRFDIAWVDLRLAVEIDGAVWARGRHTRGSGFEADCCKINEAQIQGWKVLRYSTGQVKQGIPILDLKRLLA